MVVRSTTARVFSFSTDVDLSIKKDDALAKELNDNMGASRVAREQCLPRAVFHEGGGAAARGWKVSGRWLPSAFAAARPHGI